MTNWLVTVLAGGIVFVGGLRAAGLLDSIQQGDLAALEQALKSGADPNTADEHGVTALSYAAIYGSADTVKLLLRHRAAAERASKAGITPLMSAIGDLEKVRLLVEAGANVNAKSAAGNTPLFLAARLAGGEKTAEFLLAHGATPNTAILRNAVARKHSRLVRALLDRDVAVSGRTVIDAAFSGDLDILRMVIARAPDLGTPAALPHTTALMGAALHGSVEGLRLLLDRGAEIDARDNRGRTALMYAAGNDRPNPDAIRMLLEKGASAELKDVRGDTALDWARLRNHPAAVGALGGTARMAAPALIPVAENSLPPLRDALLRATRQLDAAGSAFFKANGCISCHNQSIPQMAAARAFAAGVPVGADTAATQSKYVLGIWGPERDNMWQTSCAAGGGSIATLSYGIVGLAAASQPQTRAVDLAVHCLSQLQGPAGNWTMQDSRPPLGSSDAKFTALSLRALQLYPIAGRRAEFDRRIALARTFLETSAASDTQSLAFRLLGLRWSGASEEKIAALAGQLAKLVRPGGFAQHPEMAPDPYATAVAAWALHEGAGWKTTHPVYLRAAESLRRSQEPDGSWKVRSRGFGFQPYRETGFPHGHDQWISAAATGFAVLALAPLARESAPAAASR